MNREEYYKPCTKCGRPQTYCRGECCGTPKCKTDTCIRYGKPGCGCDAVIPTATVATKADIKGLTNCFVHVADTNTTFYVDDKGAAIETWAGLASVNNYDFDANPLGFRNQIIYDYDADKAAIYNQWGDYAEFPIGVTPESYNWLTEKPSINGVTLQGNKSLDDLGISSAISTAAAQATEDAVDEMIEKTALVFDTVADMKASTDLVDGSYAHTLGYHALNDGGAGLYKIRTIAGDDTVDDGSIIAMEDGTLVAELIAPARVNVKQFGAYGDDTHDDSTAIKNALTYAVSFGSGNPKVECKAVHLPQGKYKIAKDAFGIFHGPRVKGLTFYGDGRDSTIIHVTDLANLDIGTSNTATYLFDSGNYDAFQHFTFYDIWFDTNNVGGILRINSTSVSQYSNNHFNFHSCQFTTGTLFRADGDFTGDFQAFEDCVCTTYGDAIQLNNGQSVCHYLYNCSFICYKNCITVLSGGGGDVALTSCSVILLNANDETTGRYVLNLENTPAIGQSNGNYNFNNCRFEFARYRGQVITANNDVEAYVQFNSCQFNNRYGSTFQGVVVKKRKSVLFTQCSLSNYISYYAEGAKADTTPGIIIFEKCIEPTTVLKSKCTVSGTGRIIANGLINSLALTSGNKCRDFDMGWKSYQATVMPASVKTVPLCFTGENLIRTVTLPADSYLADIYIKIPAFGTSTTQRTLTITLDSSTVITKNFAEVNGFEETIPVNDTLTTGTVAFGWNGNTITGSTATVLAKCI